MNKFLTKYLVLAILVIFSGTWLAACSNVPLPGDILFVSTRDGNAEIYSMKADGSGQVNLSNNPAEDGASAISPDGKSIFFLSSRDSDAADIYVMNADGTNQSRLTDFETGIYYDLSPDGKRIAFTVHRETFTWDIYLMDADGTGISKIDSATAVTRFVSWSPDNNRLLYLSKSAGSEDNDSYALAIYNTADSTSTISATDVYPWLMGDTMYRPSWSPDGMEIAYSAVDSDGTPVLSIINADGTATRSLSDGRHLDFWPVWSPDGKQIISIASFTESHHPYVDIHLIDTANSRRTTLSDTALEVRSTYQMPYQRVAWSPDGNQIAYCSDKAGLFDIFIMNSDGSGLKKLTTDTVDNYLPIWFP